MIVAKAHPCKTINQDNGFKHYLHQKRPHVGCLVDPIDSPPTGGDKYSPAEGCGQEIFNIILLSGGYSA
jgi:hypothetical protein